MSSIARCVGCNITICKISSVDSICGVTIVCVICGIGCTIIRIICYIGCIVSRVATNDSIICYICCAVVNCIVCCAVINRGRWWRWWQLAGGEVAFLILGGDASGEQVISCLALNADWLVSDVILCAVLDHCATVVAVCQHHCACEVALAHQHVYMHSWVILYNIIVIVSDLAENGRLLIEASEVGAIDPPVEVGLVNP